MVVRCSITRLFCHGLVSLIASGGFDVWAGLGAEDRSASVSASPPQVNVVVFTVDDMDYGSLNVTGCPVKGLTPETDKLAAEGVLLENAHVPIAVCQPSRQAMMTGLHPHRSGALGFQPVSKGVPNLSGLLAAGGWYTASFNKGRDYEAFPWTEFVDGYGTRGFGREAAAFVGSTRGAIAKARAEGKPLFLNIATSDPHRVYAGSRDEQTKLGEMKQKWTKAAGAGEVYFPPYEQICTPEQAWVPPYLPDLPAVRKEWAEYYNTVHRADATLGAVLAVLDEEGIADNTIVFYYSDNGASFPSSKQNCYPQSTRTPLIVRWPGKVKPGTRDSVHWVSTMDIMPTVLEIAGLPVPPGLDGRSLLPLLKGDSQDGRDQVFVTQNYIRPGLQVYPMRAVHGPDYSYIFNAWSDGRKKFDGECHSGLTWAAMKEATANDKKVAARVKQISLRQPEELYDVRLDPWCLHNLAADPAHAGAREKMRALLEEDMRRTHDPLLDYFLAGNGYPSAWDAQP